MPSGSAGVLLLQLGTPDAPTPKALRRYLRQFLSDRRVIDLPRPIWWAILNLVVLPRRPARSAYLYSRVWTAAGSPLLATSRAQARGVQARLEARARGAVPVAVAMRYGQPSIASAVEALLARGVDRLIAVPMYPQYAGATTGSSLEELFRVLQRRRVVPPVHVVPPYPDDAGYVGAVAEGARRSLAALSAPPEHLVVSFHGIPARYVAMGDPYQAQCELTFDALGHALAWPRERMTLAYQSRFGREPWLQPYTDETLRALRERGVRSVAVICPGFTADCLETLEEMGLTNRELFMREPGDRYHVIPCVNDDTGWLDALARVIARDAGGWLA